MSISPASKDVLIHLRYQSQFSRHSFRRAACPAAPPCSEQKRCIGLGRPFPHRQDRLHDEEPPSGTDGASQPQVERSQYKSPSSFAPTSYRRFQLGSHTVTLGVDALGEPAQVRILRDLPTKNWKEVPRNFSLSDEQDDVEAALSSKEILSSMDAEANPVDYQKVKENIEKVRMFPLDGNPSRELTYAEYQSLAKRLHDGFTTKQLEGYLAKPVSQVATKYDDLEGYLEDDLCVRSCWLSSVSTFPQDALLRMKVRSAGTARHSQVGNNFNQSADNAKPSHKRRLVEKILRHSWRLRTIEEKALDGEIDIRLDGQHLKLFVNHRSEIFKKVSERYAAKIDISISLRLIRITGPHATCLEVFRLIYYALGDIRSQYIEIPIARSLQTALIRPSNSSAPKAQQFRASLEYIEKLTSTTIDTAPEDQVSHAGNFHIYYLGSSPGDFEDARRLLIQLSERRNSNANLVYDDVSVTGSMLHQVPIQVETIMPWEQRMTKWYRWKENPSSSPIKPLNRTSGFHHRNQRRKTRNRLAELLSGSKATAGAVQKENNNEPNNYWMAKKMQTAFAYFGYVAYPLSNKTANRPTMESDERQKSLASLLSRSRTLVSHLPESLKLLTTLTPSHWQVTQEIRVVLKPKRLEREGFDIQSLPDLQISIRVDNDKRQTYLSDAQLITDKREVDMLLPKELCDIQFRSYTTITRKELSGGTKSSPDQYATDPSIIRFVDDSNLDIWKGERIQTPPRLTLFIPPFARAADAPVAGNMISVEENAGIEVGYVFTSLEHRSSMETDYEGSRLIYTTVEGGKTGGARAELRLQSDRFDQRHPSGISNNVHHQRLVGKLASFANVAQSLVTRMSQFSIKNERGVLLQARSHDSGERYDLGKSCKSFADNGISATIRRISM